MIVDFLETKISKNDLSAALRVVREFKKAESNEEWLGIPFVAWSKLEQLEEFLEHLVEGKRLKADTLRALKSSGPAVF